MDKTLLLISQSQAEAENLLQMLAGSGWQGVATTPEQMVPAPTLTKCFAVITTITDNKLLAILSDQRLPEQTPVLVIGQPDDIPPLATTPRLVDFLPGPPQRETLLIKVAFLKRVAKITREHREYLERHEQFLDWFSSRDGLTGLYNRHHFNKTSQELFNQAREAGRELAVIVCDIDFFSEINHRHGHGFGDFVLNEFSARLTDAVPDSALCFRFTGSDFIILLPDADLHTVLAAAREIQRNCCHKPYANNYGSVTITMSCGLASLTEHQPANSEEFVTMAEMALHQAKAEGRNRILPFDNRIVLEGLELESTFESLQTTISRLMEKTRSSTIASLHLLAKRIAGPEHNEHIDRVSLYTDLLGRRLGLTSSIIETLQNAVILNVSIRLLMHKDLLAKPQKLSEPERRLLHDLPYKIAQITEIFDYFSKERAILLTRCEHYDGSGFPDGLQGYEIPLGARIINITESFAAMEADRPHRKRYGAKEILHELKEEAGRQFDPFLVLKLLDIIQHDRLLELSDDQFEAIRAELLQSHPELAI